MSKDEKKTNEVLEFATSPKVDAPKLFQAKPPV